MFWAPARVALGRSGWGFFVPRRMVFGDLLRVDGTGILSPGCLLGGFRGGSCIWDGFLSFFLFFPPLFPPFFPFLKGGGGVRSGWGDLFIYFFFWGGAFGGLRAGLSDIYWGPVFLGLFVWCEWVSVSLVLALGFLRRVGWWSCGPRMVGLHSAAGYSGTFYSMVALLSRVATGCVGCVGGI